MWGGGLILIVLGVGLRLIVSILIGEPFILAYPYLNETVILIIKIIAWINIIPGLVLFVLGFWARSIATYGVNEKGKEEQKSTKGMRYLRIIIIITSLVLILAFPIGTFVGLTLLRESWMLKYEEGIESKEQIIDAEKLNVKNLKILMKSDKFKKIFKENKEEFQEFIQELITE